MSHQQQKKDKRPIIGVLLAGGRSVRMNRQDKYFSPLDNKTLLDHAIERMSPQVDKLILNVQGDISRFLHYNLPVITDEIGRFAGPLAGVHAALRYVQSHHPDCRQVISGATDSPFMPTDMVSRFLDAHDGGEKTIIQATSGGRLHPVFALWPVVLADELEEAIARNMLKVRLWTEQYTVIKVDFPIQTVSDVEIDPFFNVNRPEDLIHAQAMKKAMQE